MPFSFCSSRGLLLLFSAFAFKSKWNPLGEGVASVRIEAVVSTRSERWRVLVGRGESGCIALRSCSLALGLGQVEHWL